MFDIIGKRNWFFLFSGLILVPGIIFILLTPLTNGQMGIKFSIDYTGGTVWQFTFKNPDASIDEVKVILAQQGLSDAEVTQDTAKQFEIRTKRADLLPAATPIPAKTAAPSASAGASVAASSSPTASASPAASASAGPSASAAPGASASAGPSGSPAATLAPGSIASKDQTGNNCTLSVPVDGALGKLATAMQADSKLGPLTCTGLQNTVGPIVSAQLIQQAVLLILLGSLGILIWIGIRFQSIKFGAAALASLLHDVIVVVGIFAVLGTLFGTQIDALFVTAMMTVIGFSVHDTIVVFDRIRENRTRHAGEPFDQIVNHSILQTFGRSINTSMTVVITLVALLFFGGSAIHYFVLALLIGIISGTYSSIFNASPILVVWQLWEDRRRAAYLATLRGGRRG
ncbi:MAG TPA: protein translocase subunit SecF [Candidatus Limnocylindrales bacterium]